MDREKRHQWLMIGISASACLYLVMAFVGEPTRSFAATSSTPVVSLDIVGESSIYCSATVSITTSTGAIPTGHSTYGTGGTMATCRLITSSSLGYTLKWQISTGSGGYGTGHLNSNNVTGGQADHIFAYKPATAGTPELYAAPNGANPATTSRWAARVKSSSTIASGVVGKDWGTDVSSEKFLNVGTGSAVSLIANSSDTAGDLEYIQFKANIGSSSAQPTGLYKATIILSIIAN